MKLNNTPPPDVSAVKITDERLTFERLTFDLEDGRIVSVPLSFYPTLQFPTKRERMDFEICHSSIYWPKLDCDISSHCLLRGAKESRKSVERAGRKKNEACLSLTEQIEKLFLAGLHTSIRLEHMLVQRANCESFIQISFINFSARAQAIADIR
ncbi:MAG: DUF2442 domain-containing protein [Verrucomicrobiota bacterium]